MPCSRNRDRDVAGAPAIEEEVLATPKDLTSRSWRFSRFSDT
jgi:hypothetical protein